MSSLRVERCQLHTLNVGVCQKGILVPSCRFLGLTKSMYTSKMQKLKSLHVAAWICLSTSLHTFLCDTSALIMQQMVSKDPKQMAVKSSGSPQPTSHQGEHSVLRTLNQQQACVDSLTGLLVLLLFSLSHLKVRWFKWVYAQCIKMGWAPLIIVVFFFFLRPRAERCCAKSWGLALFFLLVLFGGLQ